jgi:ABC-type Fe3+-hydroxamate transport system substrate-binding protein
MTASPPAPPGEPRIASLVPSVTELLAELGLARWLVARTGFCIHPAALVAHVAKVGGTKDVNLAKLRKLAPTHVWVNVDENRLDTVEALRGFVPRVLVTHPVAPLDTLTLIDQACSEFGHLEGVAGRAAALRGDLLDAWRERRGLAPAPHLPQAVLYLIWRGPWMTVARDTYISRLLAAAGWYTLPAVDGGTHGAARYPVVHGTEAWLAQVQQVLLSSEPYRFGAQHLAEAQALCPQAQVRCVDGELLSWYGARTAAGLRYAGALAAGKHQ